MAATAIAGMAPASVHSHIHLDERGVAWVDDRNVKVIEIALDMIAHGVTAEQIYKMHDGYLSMSQIHAALSHYFDHRTAYDAEIERQVREDDEARAREPESPVRAKLRKLGRLP